MTREYADLVRMGALDPTKAARSALQNAASVAGLILTLDATIAESTQDDSNGGRFTAREGGCMCRAHGALPRRLFSSGRG